MLISNFVVKCAARMLNYGLHETIERETFRIILQIQYLILIFDFHKFSLPRFIILSLNVIDKCVLSNQLTRLNDNIFYLIVNLVPKNIEIS